MINISKKISIIMLLTVFISGCASFPADNIPEVKNLPDKSSFLHKPSVFLSVTMNIKTSAGKSIPAENKLGTEKFKEVIEKVTKNSNLFSSYTLDPLQGRDMNYTIKLEMTNHGNHIAAAISGFIAGVSMLIIPGAATDHYTLETIVIDHNGRELSTYTLTDSVTTWFGIWFIPLIGKSSMTITSQVWENMIKTVYQNISNDKLMQYAYIPYTSMNAVIASNRVYALE